MVQAQSCSRPPVTVTVPGPTVKVARRRAANNLKATVSKPEASSHCNQSPRFDIIEADLRWPTRTDSESEPLAVAAAGALLS